jgi:hypothetical protein
MWGKPGAVHAEHSPIRYSTLPNLLASSAPKVQPKKSGTCVLFRYGCFGHTHTSTHIPQKLDGKFQALPEISEKLSEFGSGAGFKLPLLHKVRNNLHLAEASHK